MVVLRQRTKLVETNEPAHRYQTGEQETHKEIFHSHFLLFLRQLFTGHVTIFNVTAPANQLVIFQHETVAQSVPAVGTRRPLQKPLHRHELGTHLPALFNFFL